MTEHLIMENLTQADDRPVAHTIEARSVVETVFAPVTVVPGDVVAPLPEPGQTGTDAIEILEACGPSTGRCS